MFTGYSEKVGDFFWELRFNNSREWFNPRKEEFNQLVMQPTKALANELYDWFQEQYPALGLNLHISRIYRDARRLFGRGPLKDEIWFSFQNEIEPSRRRAELLVRGRGRGLRPGLRLLDARGGRGANAQAHRSGRQADGKAGAAVCQTGHVHAHRRGIREAEGACGRPPRPWYNKRWIGFRCIRPYDAVSASRELLTFAEDGFRFMIPYYQYFDQIYRMAD